MRIRPARRIRGRVRLPGDKSISHRAAIIAALAKGRSTISNFATGADCATTVSCLTSLGVSFRQSDDALRVEGVGPRGLQPGNEVLDCGNSGSTMRMLAGVLAGQPFITTLSGDASLNSRPMNRVIEPLEMMGAKIHSRDARPPLTISGSDHLKSIRYKLPVASAQVKSCILFAALNAAGQTEVSERLGASRDHTERMLRWFGAPIAETIDGEAQAITLNGPAHLSSRDVKVPGDPSSAAFLVAAAALTPGSDLIIEDVGLNPTRTKFLSVFQSLGARIDVVARGEESNEPVGMLRISGGMNSVSKSASQSDCHLLSGELIGQLIDELPLLAVVGTQTAGGIEIRNAHELRIKESDRIAATVKNLRAMGVTVNEFEDGLKVTPGQLHGASIESYGDHRIAMAFSIAALFAEGDSEIEDTKCVGVSFPGFFSLLESIVER